MELIVEIHCKISVAISQIALGEKNTRMQELTIFFFFLLYNESISS